MIRSRFPWGATILAVLATAMLLGAVGCNAKKKASPEASITPPQKVEQGCTILIVLSAHPNPNPPDCVLSKGTRPNEDHVRWLNRSGTNLTIHFRSAWPFLGPQSDIVVADGTQSPWFTLNPATPTGPYTYGIAPPVSDPGAPGDPSISAEP